MTHSNTPAERMEETRASLRKHVFPHLNEKGTAVLEAFLANAVLKKDQTVEDVALDITATDHVIRGFKEGEVIAIAKLLESFMENWKYYQQLQASSRKAQAMQGYIDALDGALFAGGADYTKLGQLIGGLRVQTANPGNTDVIAWFMENAKTQGIKLAPNDATALAVTAALENIKQILDAPTLAERERSRPVSERVIA